MIFVKIVMMLDASEFKTGDLLTYLLHGAESFLRS